MKSKSAVKRHRYVWVLQVILILAVYFGIQYYNKSSIISGQVPEFTGQTLAGSMYSPERFRGKPYLIHFWAPWCNVCYLERNSIESLAKDHRVLTIASQSSRRDVLEYMEKNKLSYFVIMDNDGKLARLFGVNAFPTTIFVNSSNQIVFVEVGFTTEVGLRARLNLL